MSSASDLLWDYVAAEQAIERAENAIHEAMQKKHDLFIDVMKNKALMDALQGPGVICNNQLMSIDGVNSTAIEMRPMPVYGYDITNEVAGDE